jgi:chromosome segregation ATPase
VSATGQNEQKGQWAPEAERIEQLAEELCEIERAQRRLEGLDERLQAYSEERDALEAELASARRELRRIRRGLLGLWLALRGTRAQRQQSLQVALERMERRHEVRSRLIASLEAERAQAQARVRAHRPAAELRTALDAALQNRRAHLEREAPELLASLRVLEEELSRARSEHRSAVRELAHVRDISRLLESARFYLEKAIKRANFEALVLDFFLVTRSKYLLLDAATENLRAARALMEELRALDPVRLDLASLEPSIGSPLRIADYMLGSLLVNLTVRARSENSLDGVVEAQRLFADLEPVLEQAARLAQHRNDNLERRWRATLVDAVSKHGEGEGAQR